MIDMNDPFVQGRIEEEYERPSRAQEIIENISDPDEDDLYECPDCGNQSVRFNHLTNSMECTSFLCHYNHKLSFRTRR